MTTYTTGTTPDPDRPLRGRRLSWAEFERIVGPRTKPADDAEEGESQKPGLQ